jgi:nicotinamide-nucleotide adenylyltransferase
MLVPRYSVVFANDRFTLLLFQERGVKTVEAPLQDRQNLMATEVRRRMAADEDWQELVPAQVAKVIIQIDGVKRVKATALDGRLHDKQNSNNNNNNNHIYQSYHHHQSK